VIQAGKVIRTKDMSCLIYRILKVARIILVSGLYFSLLVLIVHIDFYLEFMVFSHFLSAGMSFVPIFYQNTCFLLLYIYIYIVCVYVCVHTHARTHARTRAHTHTLLYVMCITSCVCVRFWY
jgi:hypothetical protein